MSKGAWCFKMKCNFIKNSSLATTFFIVGHWIQHPLFGNDLSRYHLNSFSSECTSPQLNTHYHSPRRQNISKGYWIAHPVSLSPWPCKTLWNHGTPRLKILQWLPRAPRLKLKLHTTTRRVLHKHSPTWLSLSHPSTRDHYAAATNVSVPFCYLCKLTSVWNDLNTCFLVYFPHN